MSFKETERLEKELEELKQRLSLIQSKQLKISTLKEKNQHYCCSDVCSTFKSELSIIESKLTELDKLAYKRFPLYAKYFAELDPFDKESFKDFAVRVYNTPKERARLIKHVSKAPKIQTILLRRTLLYDMLKQIKDNNICECD